MPCYDPRDHEPYASEHAVALAERKWRHNSPVAELLCEAMQHLEYRDIKLSPALRKWWEEHQARDRKKASR